VEVYALADFALRGAPVRTGLDLGAGSGVLALLLASRGVCVTAVELRAEWLPALAAGVAASGLDLEVLRADARTIQAPAVDLVVSNPPWFPPASGPVSPDPLRAAARATLHGGPREFLAAALRLAPRACLVLRPADARALLSLAAVARAETLGDRVVLVEFTRGGDREAMDLADAGTVDVAAAYRRFGREAPTREGSSR
jgi:tRNA1(Val) A37 N6-methylase TrmN6